MKITLGQTFSFCQKGQRSNQEDARYPDCDTPDKAQRFFVVCDGVGGSEGGEVASHTVCQAFAKAMSKVDFSKDFTNKAFNEALDAAYNALDNSARPGTDMATTMTFAAFHSAGATLCHIGDSRIYQIRPTQGIIYRSDDHSQVNQMVHSGIITPEQARDHPQRNVITRYMAPVADDESRCMATVVQTRDVKKGDYFLLCTDGVLQQLSDDQLQDVVADNCDDKEKIKKMAEQCKDSTDNNTAILIPIEQVELLAGEACYKEGADTGETTVKTNPFVMEVSEMESVAGQHAGNPIMKMIKQLFGK